MIRHHCPLCGHRIVIPHLAAFAYDYFVGVLRANNWNRSKTAEVTGLSKRSVHVWIKRLRAIGYDIPDAPNGRPKW
jgi:hypothetical protein